MIMYEFRTLGYYKTKMDKFERHYRDGSELLEKYGDLYYNFRWREESTAKILLSLFPESTIATNVDVDNKTIDFLFRSKSFNLNNGEFKSSWVKTAAFTKASIGNAEFDKQNDPHRRIETYAYDGLVYSAFLKYVPTAQPYLTIAILGRPCFEKVIPFIEREQAKFLESLKKAEQENRRIERDSLYVPMYEVVESLSEEDITIAIGTRIVSKQWLMDKLEQGEATKRKRKNKVTWESITAIV